MGGGGKTPKCTDRKKNHAQVTYERAPQKHIYFGSQNTFAYIYNQCSSFLLILLMVWRYKRQYTDKTLTVRKIYELIRKFSHFHILKRQFPSICCWYFRYYALSQKHIFRSQITVAYIYNQCSFLLLLMVWRYIYNTDTNIEKICERAERASLENFRIFTF